MNGEAVKVRYSFLRLWGVFFLMFFLILCIGTLGDYVKSCDGQSAPPTLGMFFLQVLFMFAATLFFSALAMLWFGFSITPNGIKSPLLGWVLKWDSSQVVFRVPFFPILFVTSKSYWSFWNIQFLSPFFITNKVDFYAALKKYAPENNPFRTRFLTEEQGETS